MFKHLKKYNHILVTGPQRSGTTIAAKMISKDTGHRYVDERDYETFKEHIFLKLLADNSKIVVQCPSMSHIVHETANDSTLVVMMVRNCDDIVASEQRVGWKVGQNQELFRFGMSPQRAKRFQLSGGRVSELKYKRWRKKQRNSIPHYLELEYESLSKHPMWVPKEKRANYKGKQTKRVQETSANSMNTLNYITNKYNLNLSKNAKDRFVVIPGMRRRVDLAKLFAELNFKIGAEIGVMRGDFSEIICQNNPVAKLYVIDSWKEYKEYKDLLKKVDYSEFYDVAVKRLSKYNCEIVRKFSMEAVKDFLDESLDFVYIDANHALKYVVEDLVEWTKKIKPGGIISGHDFSEDKNALRKTDVVHALKAYVSAYNIDYVFVLGRRMTKDRDIIRSWFFIKKNEK